MRIHVFTLVMIFSFIIFRFRCLYIEIFVLLQRRTFQYAGGVVRTAGYWEVLAYKGSSLVAA